MTKPREPVDVNVTSGTDVESPYVKSHGTTQMVIEVDLTAEELAILDARLHAVMDMEEQVDFHLSMFKRQFGERLKKLIDRRKALHVAWKSGKGRRAIDVEVFEDDRTHEVRRVRVDTGETVTKRVLDQKEQLALFQNDPSRYVPELDNTNARQLAAEETAERDELDKLLADIDWNQIQANLAEQLGLTIEELAASAGDRSVKAKKKKGKADKSKDKSTDDGDGEEGGGDVEEES